MKKPTPLQAALLPVSTIEVKTATGSKEYSLVLDMNAIAKASEALSLDLTQIDNWRNLNAVQLSAICWAALDRFHGDVTLREVRQWLSPVQHGELFVMLVEQCWPGVLARAQKAIEDNRVGGAPPNAPETTVAP